MAESQRRRRILLDTAVLAVLAVVASAVWWRWGLAGLAILGGTAAVGGLVVWVVVMPGRLAPPVPAETLNEITDPRIRLEVADARTRLRHDLRNGALQLLTVLAVLVGAGLGFQQLAEDRNQASQDREQAIQDRQLTRQGQASERFTRAIDQLAASRLETRIGAIYGLDQIAEQAPENAGPVGEVLLAWLNGRSQLRIRSDAALREHAPDAWAVLSVLTRQRYSSVVSHRLVLRGAALRGAALRGGNLVGADLFIADLSIADLRGANLRGAGLGNASLDRANLEGANLEGAQLVAAMVRTANLGGANLRGADLRATNLRGTNLVGANLQGARIDGNTRWPRGFDWRQAGVQVVS